ncbi:ribonuclease HII [Mycoplasmopsis mustelae]|uniref:Ribonuclease n=1 Tax=Mycoplasmopsis mustelae TaxID=171289 RepID=A0A4R7UFG8_9BACT|nr:ribonuclease HIII [Mycoplasmopsis mustelae]TDV24365.1 ribonuclease HII [Mycoplasmopsis mustelae]
MFFVENLDINLSKKNVFGIDETGVGDYFTPIIACCAWLPDSFIKWAKSIGVKDSKLLSENQIIKIAEELIQKIPFTKYTLSQYGYNKLIDKKFNANEIKYFIHFHSLESFLKKYFYNKSLKNSIVLVDQYSTFNSIIKYQKRFDQWSIFKELDNLNLKIFFKQKAENLHLSVACASIIARYYLIKYMQKQRIDWNFNFILGASQKTKNLVNKFKIEYGEKNLLQVCKRNFKIN